MINKNKKIMRIEQKFIFKKYLKWIQTYFWKDNKKGNEIDH
jgi:hypothetical protein